MLYTDLKELPKYFDRYIKLVPEDMHLMDALHKYGPEYYKADLDILNEIETEYMLPTNGPSKTFFNI